MTREPLPASAIADAIYSTLDRVVEAFDVALTLIRELAVTALIAGARKPREIITHAWTVRHRFSS